MTHPLDGKTLTTAGSFTEWLKVWNETTSTEALLGLLNVGLSLPFDDPSDMLIFYLDLADLTLMREHAFDESDEPAAAMPTGIFPRGKMAFPKDLRSVLRERAWEKLKAHYFTHQDYDEDGPRPLYPIGGFGSRAYIFESEGGFRLLERLISFSSGRYPSNLRLSTDRDDTAKRFFKGFVEWLLRQDRSTKNSRTAEKADLHNRIEARKRLAMKDGIILARALEATSFLERLEVDDSAELMQVLKGLALDRWGTGKDVHASLEAALLYGEELARIYFLREARERALRATK